MYIRDLETAITQNILNKEIKVHIIVPLNIHYVLGCEVWEQRD